MTQQLLDIIADISGWIGSLLYGLFGSLFFKLMDWLQGIFRSLAGLEAISINGEIINSNANEAKYDIVYYLIGTDIVIDIFISMFAFSTVLLIIMTVIALVKNSYVDKPKPVMDIIGKSFKGLLGFLLVPIACIVGLMFGNVLLELVDSATGGANSSNMSANLFMSSAYDSNWLRNDELDTCQEKLLDLLKETNFEEYSGVSKYLPDNADGIWKKAELYTVTRSDYDSLADLLDDCFTSGSLVRASDGVTLTIYKAGQAKMAYELVSINYVIMIVAGCCLLGVLFKMCWGMIGRVFKLVIDFVMIPVVLAMMPYDDGKAVGAWKGEFVKNVTLAYATIGVLNIYYSILPVLNNISLVNNGGPLGLGAIVGSAFFNNVFKVMLQIIGIFSADGIIKAISGWFGGGDLLGEGANTWKTLKDGTKKIQDTTANASKKVTGVFTGGVAGWQNTQGGAVRKFGGAMSSAISSTGVTKGFGAFDLKKNISDGMKAGKEHAEARESMSFSKASVDMRKAERNLKGNIEDIQKQFKVAGANVGDKAAAKILAKDNMIKGATAEKEIKIGTGPSAKAYKKTELEQVIESDKEKVAKDKEDLTLLSETTKGLATLQRYKNLIGATNFDAVLQDYKDNGTLDLYNLPNVSSDEDKKNVREYLENYISTENSLITNARETAEYLSGKKDENNNEIFDSSIKISDKSNEELLSELKSIEVNKIKTQTSELEKSIANQESVIKGYKKEIDKVNEAAYILLDRYAKGEALTKDELKEVKSLIKSIGKDMGKDKGKEK